MAALLCGRRFPLDMREKMYDKFFEISQAKIDYPNRDILTSKVIRALFARDRATEK